MRALQRTSQVSSKKPDVIVGVDFGTTCTGCAYIDLSSGSRTVRWVQKWPGRLHVNENKVPTLLAYSSFDESPIGWGFLGEKSGQDRTGGLLYAEHFKTFLDPVELRHRQLKDQINAPESKELVEKWLEDYLRALYQHLEFHLGKSLIRPWKDAYIQFIFSLPTTWTDKNIVENFRTIIKKAGYGGQTYHAVELGLTEAEAAAVHISREQAGLFRTDDIILVCDAGGGTTDLSVLQVDSTNDGVLSLRQLDVVSGKSIGSVAIDAEFADMVCSRLVRAFNGKSFEVPDGRFEDLAWTMAKCAEYQNMKCEFGEPTTQHLSIFSCPAPWFRPEYVNMKYNITNQTMKFDRSEFQSIFDNQLQKLFSHMDNQLRSLERKLPAAQINYLVLSGGLGNSAYVQQRLKARYENGGSSRYPNIRQMQVKVAVDPQLAVCKGLVEDYLQKLQSGRSTIATRVCRESYGILCSIPQTPENQGQFASHRAELDPTDNKMYYRGMVRWLIRRGETLSEDQPVESDFWRLLRPGDPNRTFTSKIVVSGLDASKLQPWRTADVRELCEISSTLVGVAEKEFEEKNKGKFGFRNSNRHFIARFQVKVIIGPADLQFHLWFKGRRISADNAIQVAWASSPGDVASQPVDVHRSRFSPVEEYL